MKTSAPSLTIADRLRAERRASFVGRELELERMLSKLDDERAQVMFVLGSGGIGKTRLLGAFAQRLTDRAVPVRVIDCESVLPTPAGFLAALAEMLGCALPSVRAAAAALSELGPRVVRNRAKVKHVKHRVLALAFALLLPAACSRDRRAGPAGDPCSRLDLSLLDQATVAAYAEAAAALRSRLAEIEGRVFYACDGMNARLGLSRPRNTYDGCATLRARVDEARAAGAQITLRVSASCTVDGAARERCQERCQLQSCDAAACPDSAPCEEACGAVADAGVQCAADTVAVTSNVDAQLGDAVALSADEWGTLESLVAELQATVTELGPPLLAYSQAADVIGKDEQDCYQNALGDLGVALISFDAARDGLASLCPVFSAASK